MHSATTHDTLAAGDNPTCLVVGTAAAAVATLALSLPSMVPTCAAAIVLAFSFLENERFLLAVIFLQPFDIVSRAIPVVSDCSLALHTIVVVGFFVGRLYRRQLQLGSLWRAATTRWSFLFLASVALSAVSGLPGLGQEKIRGLYFVAVYFGFYLFASVWLVTDERIRRALRALLISTILANVFALLQWIANGYTRLYTLMYQVPMDEWNQRPPSWFPGPNALAGYQNLILPFAIAGCLLSKERSWRRLCGAAAATGIVTLVLTQSRGGYLAFAITVVFAIWHFASTHKQRLALLLALALLGAGSYAALCQWNPTHFDNFDEDHSTLTRVILWYTAWNLFLSSPVHGIGYGTFSFISHQYMPVVIDMPEGYGVHNIYLELLAETGALGLLSFLAVGVSGIRRARRQCRTTSWFQRAIGFGAAAGMTAMLVGGFVDHNVLWAPQIAFSFWLWLALVSSVANPKPVLPLAQRAGQDCAAPLSE